MPKKKVSKTIDPTTVVSKALVKETLKHINKLRKASGVPVLKAIPAGIPGSRCNCPIAVALKPIGVTAVNGDTIEAKVTTVGIGGTRTESKTYEQDGSDGHAPPDLLNSAFETFREFVSMFDDKDTANATPTKSRDKDWGSSSSDDYWDN